jgi:hypothetical protein
MVIIWRSVGRDSSSVVEVDAEVEVCGEGSDVNGWVWEGTGITLKILFQV